MLDQYLEEALFLMQLIGITVFSDKKTNTLINTIDIKTKLALGKRAKSDAIDHLKNQGILVEKNVTYSTLQNKSDRFWSNPKVNLLEKDWYSVLNNNNDMELFVLEIPAKSLNIQTDKKEGLRIRQDKPNMLDLNIDSRTFIDYGRKINFSPFIKKKVKY